MRTWTHDQIHLLFLAAKDLREAQRAYMSDKNQQTGSRVGGFMANLDGALQNLMRERDEDPYPHQAEARALVEACVGMRAAQHKHMATKVLSVGDPKETARAVWLAAEVLDEAIDDIKILRDQPTPSMG